MVTKGVILTDPGSVWFGLVRGNSADKLRMPRTAAYSAAE